LTGQQPSSNDGVDEEKAIAGASALLVKTLVKGGTKSVKPKRQASAADDIGDDDEHNDGAEGADDGGDDGGDDD